MSNIAEKITNIIVDKLGVDAADVNPDANFTTDLGADSLDIPDEQAEKIQTVGNAIDYLNSQIQG
jgi:acyl carrier protein